MTFPASNLRRLRLLLREQAALRLALAALLGAGCSTTESLGAGSSTEGSGSTGGGTTSGATTKGGATSSGSGGQTGTSGGGTGTGGASTGGGTSGGTGGSGGTTGGSGLMPECTEDTQCKVVDDCCTCAAWPEAEPAPECPIQDCFATTCTTSKYVAKPQAVCLDGLCRFPKTTCDPSEVICLAPSPACEPGFLPEVEGQCWSGACIPVAACDWAPGCDACDEGQLCVIEQTQMGPKHRCEPMPWQCGDGPADCACAGQLCGDPYDTCGEGQGGTLECSCPDC